MKTLSIFLLLFAAASAAYAGNQSDTWINLKVKAALLANNSTTGIKSNVEVNDGIVTLRGEVNSKAQKDLATETAERIEGVKSVRNEMTIVDPKTKDNKQDLSKTIDDMTITAKIKAALFADKSTSGMRTVVETKDGVVTLSGNAQSQEEKNRAEEVAKGAEGVRRVVNNMAVVKPQT